jgi:polyphenol oxidase
MTIELPLKSAAARGWTELPFAHPAWLTLRQAGDMRESGARRGVLEAIGIAPESVCMVRQIHSRRLRFADELVAAGSTAAGDDRLEADGILSVAGGPVLAVGVGDCVPIFVADTRTGAYGILHSGWKGTGILRDAVVAMGARYGTRPEDLVVLLGPCISGESYAVDEARAREYEAEWGPHAVVRRANRAYLDMRAANATIARDAGIRTVSIVNHCTVLTAELGSYRREGPHYTGMLAAVGPDRTPR